MYRFRNASARKVSPPFKPDEMGGVWTVFITIDPNDSDTVFTGAQRVYRTKNDGLSWDALTPILDGSPISAIEVAAADSKFVYVGTENGGFFASVDGGQTWSANLASSMLPGMMIARIDTPPTNGVARQALVDMAEHVPGYQAVAKRPSKFCHGFGVFQLDLQSELVEGRAVRRQRVLVTRLRRAGRRGASIGFRFAANPTSPLHHQESSPSRR